MAAYVFKRTEKKYVIDEKMKKILVERFAPYIQPHKYHSYTLCNAYYDTDDFELIRRSIEKPDFKEKLRIRCYEVPCDKTPAYVELKRKYDGTVYKRRLEMSYAEAKGYVENCKCIEGDHISEEIAYFCSVYKVSPKAFISYDREAFCGRNDENLRVTFDSDIRYSFDNNEGFEKNGEFRRLLRRDECIMEIKANGGIPVEMASILSTLEIYPQPFSKYGRAYIKEKKEGRL